MLCGSTVGTSGQNPAMCFFKASAIYILFHGNLLNTHTFVFKIIGDIFFLRFYVVTILPFLNKNVNYV